MATLRTDTEISDGELLDRHRAGDRRAFAAIVARHRKAVYMVARRFLRSHADADEAAQATFVRAWRALDGFRGESALRTWLIRITLNVAKTMAAAGAHRGDGPEDWEGLPDPGAPADERLGREQARCRVRAAVAALPPRQREVVLLKVFSDLMYSEVAEALELSEGAVKAHLHQAIANLRRRMTAAGEGSAA